MSADLDVEVLEEKHVSNPEAKEILEKLVKRLEVTTGTTTLLIQRTLDYLRKFSKMEPEDAEALSRELDSFNLKTETKIMLINICPETLDELRPLLILEERLIETEEAEKILDVVNKYCRK